MAGVDSLRHKDDVLGDCDYSEDDFGGVKAFRARISNANVALLAFLKAVSDASVRGITMLNVYSAICVIFWAKTPVNTVLKAAMVGLPFSVFPISLLTRSIMKLVEKGGCSLDLGATLVLLEFIYIYMLGGITTTVMFEASKGLVAAVTAVVICIVLKLWSCFSNHPKFLRVINSNREDLEKSPTMLPRASVTEANNAKVATGIPAKAIRIFLNICLGLYLVFSLGFMLGLAIVAEKWWHALVGICVMSPIHVLGLYLTSYLRDRM